MNTLSKFMPLSLIEHSYELCRKMKLEVPKPFKRCPNVKPLSLRSGSKYGPGVLHCDKAGNLPPNVYAGFRYFERQCL